MPDYLTLTSYPNNVAYDYFVNELENVSRYLTNQQKDLPLIGEDDSFEKNLLRNAIIAVTNKIYLSLVLAAIKEDDTTK